MKEPLPTLIVLVVGGAMIMLGLEWAEDPANIGGAVVLGLGYVVTAFSAMRLALLLLRRK